MSDGAIGQWTNAIHCGDVVETLREMPESSVHMCMTSPPFYGLRDYGEDGQIGLEDSIDEYVEQLVGVGDELRRVLRDDGSWWLNLGDSFAGSWGGQSHDEEENPQAGHHPDKNPGRNTTVRRKSKMLVPHRVAIGLQEAGWIVRSDAVWSKPNPMPHPVKDRLVEHKEFVFHLTPKPDYYFNLDAIREPHKEDSLNRGDSCFVSSGSQMHASPNEDGQRESVTMDKEQALHENGKNPGDVFEIPVKAFPEAHFAVYPPELCEKPIKASCPEDGVVLDPFAGAGTTCLVAKRLGREFVGIDLNPDYVALAQSRVGIDVDEPERLLDENETSLEVFADGE